MIAGVVFSVIAAILLNAGNIVQKYSVVRMPKISVRRKYFFIRSLLTSRTWMLGFFLCLIAVGIQTIALSLTPLSVSQSIFVAGIVSLMLISRIKLRERLEKREIIGLVIVVSSLIAISASLRTSSQDVGVGGSGSVVVLTALVTLALICALLYVLNSRISNLGLLYGVISGLIYGVASLGTKGASTLMHHYGVVDSIPYIMSSTYPYVFIVFSLIGMFVFQTGLQRYQISVVGSMADVAASCYLVAVGSILFNEHWPTNPIILASRLTGFAGVLAGSVVVATAKTTSTLEKSYLTEVDTKKTARSVAGFKSPNGQDEDFVIPAIDEITD